MTNPSIASGLLPCPFCGDSATVSYWGPETQILCTNCNALSAAFSGDGAEQRAIEAWNARIAPEALSQLTREVDDILDEADFLCARLRELENELSDDHTARQFYGHVAPSLARMEALSRSSGRVSDAG